MKEETRIKKLQEMPDSYFKWLKVVSAGLRLGCFDKRWYIEEQTRLATLGFNKPQTDKEIKIFNKVFG